MEHRKPITVDITFETSKHTGLNTKELIIQLQNDFPLLKPLTLVLKQFLVEKGLNDPYLGGLSSYALVIMITSCLQRFSHIHRSADLGFLLCAFLTEFSDPRRINRKVSIHAVNNSLTSVTEYGLGVLFIEDPLDLSSNVGRACHGIRQVQQAFADALDAIRLSSAVVDADRSLMSTWSILGRIFTAGHHNNVILHTASVWCPPERLSVVSEVASSVRSTSMNETITLKLWALRACGMLDRIVRETQGNIAGKEPHPTLKRCPFCGEEPLGGEEIWEHNRPFQPEHYFWHHPSCPLLSLLVEYNNVEC